VPLPGSVTMVTVTGTILHPVTGAGATGAVTFTIPSACRTTDGYLIGNLPAIVAPVVNGVFTASLPATDNTNVIPQGWVYTVAVATDAYTGVFQAALSSTPNPTTFAAMTPVSTTTPAAVYVPLTAVGHAYGVASLDATGKVPAGQLPTGSGGGGVVAFEWTQVAPASVWTIPHNLGYRPPGVRVKDSGGRDWYGWSITDVDLNTVAITVGVAIAGTAELG
jgi:hypothetical protein